MKNKGFTLIELMIVIAIVGILAAVAVPQYSQYTKKAKFSEIKLAVSPIKSAIELCYHNNAGDDACNTLASVAGISGQVTPRDLERAASASLVGSVVITGATFPIIEVTSAIQEGFNGETFILTGIAEGTPGLDRTVVDWEESGTACDEGYC